jgi:hypothetical protein
MSKLTQEERRRVWLTQQQASQRMLASLTGPTAVIEPPRPDGRLVKALVKTALLVSLLGGGYIAAQILEFHPPASIVEALLPRL